MGRCKKKKKNLCVLSFAPSSCSRQTCDLVKATECTLTLLLLMTECPCTLLSLLQIRLCSCKRKTIALQIKLRPWTAKITATDKVIKLCPCTPTTTATTATNQAMAMNSKGHSYKSSDQAMPTHTEEHGYKSSYVHEDQRLRLQTK